MPTFLSDIEINEISLVDKGANQRTVIFKRANTADADAIREIRIIEKSDDKRLVIGVVYAPDEIDAQGEYTSAEEIEKAAHKFLAAYRIVKAMHEEKVDADVVESFITPSDFVLKSGERVKAGSWMAVIKVNSDAVWAKVKSGEYAGFSMGGKGRRVQKTQRLGRVWHDVEKGKLAENLNDLLADMDARNRAMYIVREIIGNPNASADDRMFAEKLLSACNESPVIKSQESLISEKVKITKQCRELLALSPTVETANRVMAIMAKVNS